MNATGEGNGLSDNRRTLVKLSIVASLMFGFGYAMVPFYKQICLALGLNSLVPVATATAENTQIDFARTVSIELDANAHHMPWRFRPLQNHIEVHPGELTTIEYEIVNTRNVAVTGQAVPSYGPQLAGQFFSKLECFCFTKQTLAAGETRRMPVVFLIDPKLPADVKTITLSYTFFEVAGMGGKVVMAGEAPRKATFAEVAKAVFWSFFGVRKKKDYASDSASISPVQVIVAGIVGAALFVLTLVMVVKLVTS